MKKLLSLFLALVVCTTLSAATTRTLDGQQITNGAATLTLPTSTDTLVGKATTDTFTNKTISGSSNTFSNIPTSAIAGSALSGTNSGDVTIGTANGLSLAGQALSLQAADSTHTGALTSSDWTLFNGKLSTTLTTDHIFVGVGGVATDTAVAGDISLSSGSFTIGAKKVQASKLDSGAAAANTVATADGSGGVSYQAIPSVAPALTGTIGSPTAITAAGGISFSGSNYTNIKFITGSGGAVTVTANPQIAAGSLVGQYLELIGGANTVTLADGNGLSLNGSWVGGTNSALEMIWDGSSWHEISRR